MSTQIPFAATFARCIDWADPADLEGLPIRDQVIKATNWVKQGISARARTTPLDRITDDGASYRRLVGAPQRISLSSDLVAALREDLGPTGVDGLPPHGGQIRPSDLSPRQRTEIAESTTALAFTLRDDIRFVGGWEEARLARQLHQLSLSLLDNDQLPRPRYTPASVVRSVRSCPARIATAREQWFLEHALLSTDDEHHFALSRIMPAWIRQATRGCYVHPAEAGRPQVCRFWDYVNWPRLLQDHPGQLSITEENWPTAAPLWIVEDARAHGYDATLDVALYLNGFTPLGRPRFQLEAWGMTIDSSLPLSLADRYTDLIRDNYRREDMGCFISYERAGRWVGGLEALDGSLSQLIDTYGQDTGHSDNNRSEVHHWDFA